MGDVGCCRRRLEANSHLRHIDSDWGGARAVGTQHGAPAIEKRCGRTSRRPDGGTKSEPTVKVKGGALSGPPPAAKPTREERYWVGRVPYSLPTRVRVADRLKPDRQAAEECTPPVEVRPAAARGSPALRCVRVPLARQWVNIPVRRPPGTSVGSYPLFVRCAFDGAHARQADFRSHLPGHFRVAKGRRF